MTEILIESSSVREQSRRAARARPRLRPPAGIPLEREGRARSAVASVLLHAAIILALIAPYWFATTQLEEVQGAGGPGPAGGGGGGRRGTGGVVSEQLHYIASAPPPPPVPAVTPTVVPPVEQKKEELLPKIEFKVEAPKEKLDAAMVPGTGGGTGNDGTSGSGPGSGGGVGSGVGTGRGNANGPGTGGGPGTIYPPVPTQVFLPPMPVPEKIKPYHLVVVFDVDEKGKVLSFTFNKTRDGGYNRKLEEMIRDVMFRPATRWDGTPVRAQAVLEFSF